MVSTSITANVSIENNNAGMNDYNGIYLENTTNGSISNNSANSNFKAGIMLISAN